MSRRSRAVLAISTLLMLLGGCATAAAPSAQPIPTGVSPAPTASPLPPTIKPVAPTASAAPAATANPTSTAVVTESPSPAGSPTPQAPTVTPAPTQGLVVTADQFGPHLEALQDIADANDGLRAAGLPGYDESADYVAGQLEAMGYSVERDTFTFDFFDEAAPVVLTVGEAAWSGADWLHAMLYSPSGYVSGVLETVALEGAFSVGTGGCEPSDWTDFTPGRIALLGSGPCFRRDQLLNAQAAGAIGVISVYPRWESGQTRRPTLFATDGLTIPAIVAGQEPTEALLAAAATGGSATFNTENVIWERTIDNVLAERPGTTDRVVMLGGHLDSVLDGPGLNDNASGVSSLLAIAQSLMSQPMPTATVRFAFWGAEEFGDLGSSDYVMRLAPQEIARIDAYLNLDMVGSPNAARFVYQNELSPEGSGAITDALLAALDEMGLPGQVFDAGPSSDHFAFEQVGIPIGGVFSGLAPLTEDQAALFGGVAREPADPCYHLACDTVDNVDVATAAILSQAVATVLEDLAY